jgi:hypothetical protein
MKGTAMRKSRIVAALAFTLALLVAVPAPARAEDIGARWSGPIRVYDATGDARWGVAQAAREWAASGVPIVVVTTPCAPGCITVIEDPYQPYVGLSSWSANGTTITSCGVRLLTPHAAMTWAHRITGHELGHCLGLAHTLHKGSIMVTGTLTPPAPTSWDLGQLRRLYR